MEPIPNPVNLLTKACYALLIFFNQLMLNELKIVDSI